MKRFRHFIEKCIVWPVEFGKRVTGLDTYVFEMGFVFVVLAIVALISHKGYVEWIGVFAVFFTFGHMSVAETLREQEEARAHKGDPVTVECYGKLETYYFLKEGCWFVYFLLLGAWSALAGCVLFLFYGPWRKLWRKYHPLP